MNIQRPGGLLEVRDLRGADANTPAPPARESTRQTQTEATLSGFDQETGPWRFLFQQTVVFVLTDALPL